jgi:hypothetical protein
MRLALSLALAVLILAPSAHAQNGGGRKDPDSWLKDPDKFQKWLKSDDVKEWLKSGDATSKDYVIRGTTMICDQPETTVEACSVWTAPQISVTRVGVPPNNRMCRIYFRIKCCGVETPMQGGWIPCAELEDASRRR